ncbi:HD domain-containing protein [Streptomyces brasiliscabiei]|uniref:HD domain-containing protein n=1 Tax=Streptomyces brasiliscabiei TaxID=2736302 RepID=A0ABU8G3Z1_9ACTN
MRANVRALISGVLPGGEGDGRRLAVWLAGVHDIGKVTPAFECQVDQLADVMRRQGLEMRTRRQLGPDRRPAPHRQAISTAGHRSPLRETTGGGMQPAVTYSSVLAGDAGSGRALAASTAERRECHGLRHLSKASSLLWSSVPR